MNVANGLRDIVCQMDDFACAGSRENRLSRKIELLSDQMVTFLPLDPMLPMLERKSADICQDVKNIWRTKQWKNTTASGSAASRFKQDRLKWATLQTRAVMTEAHGNSQPGKRKASTSFGTTCLGSDGQLDGLPRKQVARKSPGGKNLMKTPVAKPTPKPTHVCSVEVSVWYFDLLCGVFYFDFLSENREEDGDRPS